MLDHPFSFVKTQQYFYLHHQGLFDKNHCSNYLAYKTANVKVVMKWKQ